jgi:hypothetical protein
VVPAGIFDRLNGNVRQCLGLKSPLRGCKLRAKKSFGFQKKSFQTFQTFQSAITGSSAICYDSSMKRLCE